MEYIIILVDSAWSGPPRSYEHETEYVKVELIRKGSQMVGLRYKNTRPTLIIDTIQDRTLVRNGEDVFDKWYSSEVLRNITPKPKIVKKRPS